KLFIESTPRKKLTDFDKIITLINTHLFNPELNAKFICNQCYITPEHLSRLFKKNMNLHFSSYVNTERIKKASALLLDTEATKAGMNRTDYLIACAVGKRKRSTQNRLGK
ncbi:MAG: hypothetical protein IKZ28_02960, partial [Clostridia bacterium]|nr:hypothetical protein [Clostridia bacterium]